MHQAVTSNKTIKFAWMGIIFGGILALAGCGGGGGESAAGSTLMGGAKQGVALNLTALTATVSPFVGSSGFPGSGNGSQTDASFQNPLGITTDGINLYVADSFNYTIRKIVIATGEVSTLAGTVGKFGSTDSTIGTEASFRGIRGITTDGINLYVADTDNHTIRKIAIAAPNAVSTLAGSLTGLFGSDNAAIGTNARFEGPRGITTDGVNLYVADTNNHTIRKIAIAAPNAVSTLAGVALSSGSSNGGVGAAAMFKFPEGITTDGTYLYVADSGNHTIRKIEIANRTVSPLAGEPLVSGSANAVGTNARFNKPYGITTDGFSLYVAEGGNHTIRKIVLASSEVSLLAGTGVAGSTEGGGTVAKFSSPSSLTTDGISLYVADTNNHTIRKIH